MTTYEALSLVGLFGQVLIACLVLAVTIVVYISRKK